MSFQNIAERAGEKAPAIASTIMSGGTILSIVNDWLDTATIGAGLLVLILTAVWWVYKIKRERAELRRIERK